MTIKTNLNSSQQKFDDVTVGVVGWWDSPLGEHNIWVVLDRETIQLYDG